MGHWLRKLFSGIEAEKPTVLLHWPVAQHYPVVYINHLQVRIGPTLLRGQSVRIEEISEDISFQSMNDALQRYGNTTAFTLFEKAVTPQLAAVVYDITRRPRTMSMYFPMAEQLDDIERHRFEENVEHLAQDPNFHLKIWDLGLTDVTDSAPPSIAYIVAGHIVEMFFYRPDLSSAFFSTPRNFNIYMNSSAYAEGGGVAGGCYDPRTGSLKLLASRLFEGFFNPTPGVAPFIHEFGHMLDAFDISTATMRSGSGLLPGMHETDGDLFSAGARTLFLQGKKLELERYERVRKTRPRNEKDIPIGHPYVFQNDGEFIAGYLEMFFRNPHYFHRQNPTLFEGFSVLFNQDPRAYWKTDFDYYVTQNRAAYLWHRHDINPSGLQVVS